MQPPQQQRAVVGTALWERRLCLEVVGGAGGGVGLDVRDTGGSSECVAADPVGKDGSLTPRIRC